MLDHTTRQHIGQPLGRTILGPKENILSISRDDLSNYIKTNYTADRMVLVGTGGIEHASLVDLAKNHFGSLPTSSSPIKLGESTQKTKPSFVGSEVKVRDDTMPTCNVAIAVEGVSWSSPDYYPMLVMQSVMGNWDRSLGAQSILSSRLSHTSLSPLLLSTRTRIRTDSICCLLVSANNLANSFMSFSTSYSDTGLWGIYMVSENFLNLDDMTHFTLKVQISIPFPSELELTSPCAVVGMETNGDSPSEWRS